MAEHRIKLTLEKGEVPFTYDAYPRNHVIIFKNGEDADRIGRARLQGRCRKAIRKRCWSHRCRPVTC